MLNGKKMSSLSSVFRFAKLKTIILTTLVIAGVCGAAGFYYCNNMEQKTEARSGDTVGLSWSDDNESDYGHDSTGWATHIFSVTNGNNVFEGMCAEPGKATPDIGNYVAVGAGSSSADNRIKLMIYIQTVNSSAASAQRSAILGQFESDTSSWFGYAHAIISYIYGGTGWNNGLSSSEQSLVVTIADSTLANLINSNSTVWQETQGYGLYYLSNSPQQLYWIEPENGGLKVQKTDANTGLTTPQGDVSSFAGTKFTIYQSNGTTEVAQITADANGVATTSQNALPFGTYVVKETTAPTGYRSTDQSVTITVDSVNTIATATTSFTNQVYLGNIKVKKCDAETNECEPLGNASFEGIEFELYNRSTNAVYYNGQSYAAGALMDTKETDENGELTFSNLPYGTYGVKESEANESYLLSDTTEHTLTIRTDGETKETTFYDYVVRGDVKFNKTDGATGLMMADVPFKIKSQTTEEEHIVVSNEDGHVNTSAGWNLHSYHTNGYDEETEFENLDYGTWFGLDASGEEVTVDDLLGALPYDTYEITELECPSNRNCRPLTEVKTFSITQNGVIVDLGEWVNDCDLIEYSLRTNAKNAATGDKTLPMNSTVTVTDEAEYCLDEYSDFTIIGTVMNKTTGLPLTIGDENVVASAEIHNTDESCGSVSLNFEFNTTGLDGVELVVFEEIYDEDDNLIIAHEDLNDTDQTVKVDAPDPVTPETGFMTGVTDGSLSGLTVTLVAIVIAGTTGFVVFKILKKRYL